MSLRYNLAASRRPKGWSMLNMLIRCCGVLTIALACGIPQSFADDASPPPTPLNPEKTVLLDKAGGRVLVRTTVCLRRGILEMFACPKQTKEHESILSFDGKAQTIHAGLLALGLEPGHPARFGEKFELPEGPKLDLFVTWEDSNGKAHRRAANEWVRGVTYRYFAANLAEVPKGVVIDKGDESLRYDPNTKELLWFGTMSKDQRQAFQAYSDNKEYRAALQSLYDQSQPKQVETEWVFAGSRFAETPEGKQIYQAEAGSLICVANFGDALIDVAIESSNSDAGGRLFEPYEERIPPEGTPVTIEISASKKAKEAKGEKQ
ncbi:MAG: hypothetical protein KDA69_04725 [Planctomycetaceae bacterium]|nr:hypothetical protein [Planctomycetaceae bacterium]